jgi:UDP-N-acetylmuramyl pentapeptide phosphotransferase/UDP-N-acetylglucosamine-1-phosphate transferase
MATSLIGALLAFLIFNAQPARIFMGDTGSMMLGLLHAMMVIQFLSTAPTAPIFPMISAPAIGFSIMFVPLFDTLRVFSFRMLRGTSPFTPDRNHIHHILLRFRLSHNKVVAVLSIVAVFFPIAVWMLRDIGSNWLLLGMIGVGFGMVGVLVLRYKVVSSQTVIQGGVGTIGKKRTAIRSISPPDRKVAGHH